jgi:hypothetical protein
VSGRGCKGILQTSEDQEGRRGLGNVEVEGFKTEIQPVEGGQWFG